MDFRIIRFFNACKEKMILLKNLKARYRSQDNFISYQNNYVERAQVDC